MESIASDDSSRAHSETISQSDCKAHSIDGAGNVSSSRTSSGEGAICYTTVRASNRAQILVLHLVALGMLHSWRSFRSVVADWQRTTERIPKAHDAKQSLRQETRTKAYQEPFLRWTRSNDAVRKDIVIADLLTTCCLGSCIALLGRCHRCALR